MEGFRCCDEVPDEGEPGCLLRIVYMCDICVDIYIQILRAAVAHTYIYYTDRYPHKQMPSVARGARDRVRPALKIGVRMRRKPQFFYFNHFGPLFMIGNLNGVALVIPPDDLATRAQIILTLILTLVAFKMTISQMLPRLPYPTILDKCARSLQRCGAPVTASPGTVAAHVLVYWHCNAGTSCR